MLIFNAAAPRFFLFFFFNVFYSYISLWLSYLISGTTSLFPDNCFSLFAISGLLRFFVEC